ncbi:MAG: flagellar biosynthesis anti-sigma factor FlgM [Armatimonadota bacterium]
MQAARWTLAARYAEVLAAAAEAMATMPAIRARKVRGIRDRLSRGEYSPTAAAIAGRLVGV